MEKNNLIQQLEKIVTRTEPAELYSGLEYDFLVPGDNLREFTKKLYDEGFSLVFVSAVHTNPKIAVIYQFVMPEDNIRIRGRVFVSENKQVDTISDIFSGASWYEREVMEFFGLDFKGNPDKRNLILSDTDKGLNPLLKKEEKVKEAEELGL